jgi:hypothetical protein
MKHQELYYDQLSREFSRRISANAARGPDGMHPKTIDQIIREPMSGILKESRLFLLNSAVVDDLYHYPAENTDFSSLQHLPFPTLFFELTDPLEFKREKDGREMKLRAILFGRGYQTSPSLKLMHKSDDKIGRDLAENVFCASCFYENPENPSDNYAEMLCGEDAFNQLKGNGPVEAFQGDLFGDLSLPSSQPDKPTTRSFSNIFRLCVNILSYINAHNATIRKTERNRPDLDAVNRRRANKGKKVLEPLKPYYWVDVKQTVVDERKRREEGAKLDYREWVRGHFWRYRAEPGVVRIWVDPYVRGPETAPWKENRYHVLADMLTHKPN